MIIVKFEGTILIVDNIDNVIPYEADSNDCGIQITSSGNCELRIKSIHRTPDQLIDDLYALIVNTCNGSNETLISKRSSNPCPQTIN